MNNDYSDDEAMSIEHEVNDIEETSYSEIVDKPRTKMF